MYFSHLIYSYFLYEFFFIQFSFCTCCLSTLFPESLDEGCAIYRYIVIAMRKAVLQVMYFSFIKILVEVIFLLKHKNVNIIRKYHDV